MLSFRTNTLEAGGWQRRREKPGGGNSIQNPRLEVLRDLKGKKYDSAYKEKGLSLRNIRDKINMNLVKLTIYWFT